MAYKVKTSAQRYNERMDKIFSQAMFYRNQQELAEKFMAKRFPKEPKDTSYYAEWRDRFNSGHPETWMDSESLKVYNKLKKKSK